MHSMDKVISQRICDELSNKSKARCCLNIVQKLGVSKIYVFKEMHTFIMQTHEIAECY